MPHPPAVRASSRDHAVRGRAAGHGDDFTSYDLILAMDRQNLRDLQRLAPLGLEHRARLLAEVDVPDPYYGEGDGFDRVLDIVETACARLLDDLRQD